MELPLAFNICFGFMFVFWPYMSENFLSKIPKKASESFLSEVVFLKHFCRKEFDINTFAVRALVVKA